MTRLIVGFVRVKYSALAFGPAGTGILAQATQLTSLGASLGSLSMGVGIINRMASEELRADPLRRRKMLGTALLVQLALSMGLLAIGVIFSSRISFLVFGEGHPSWRIFVVLFSVPLSVLASSYLEGVLFGLNRYDYYVRGSIIATVGGLGAFLPLAYFFGLDGAFAGLLFGTLLLFVSFLWYATRLLPWRELFCFSFSREELTVLLRFSGVMITTGAATYGSAVLMRRLVIGSLGAGAAGIMQVPLALTAYYTPFLTNALWGRLHPFASRVGDCPEAREELQTILLSTMILNTAFILGIACVADFLIRLAYSHAFMEARTLLPAQLLGDFFYFIAFTVSVYFLGAAKLRVYLIGWLAFFTVQVGGVALLLPSLGLRAIPLSYLAASLGAALVSLTWFLRVSGSWRSALVLGGCLLFVGTQLALAAREASLGARMVLPLVFGLMLLAGGRFWRQRLVNLPVPSHA